MKEAGSASLWGAFLFPPGALVPELTAAEGAVSIGIFGVEKRVDYGAPAPARLKDRSILRER